jgi:hypothetical protein
VPEDPPPGLAVAVAVDLGLDLDAAVVGLGLDLPVGASGARTTADRFVVTRVRGSRCEDRQRGGDEQGGGCAGRQLLHVSS